MALIKFSTPPTLAGLFFCLASVEGAGLFFLPRCNAAPYKRLQRILCRQCIFYIAHATKQHTGLYRRFSCNYTRLTAHDTRPTQADIIPSAPRWSVSQRRSVSSAYQIPPPRRTLYNSAQPPYYNKVYKGAPPVMDPCQIVQHTIQTMPAWHPPHGRTVQQRDAAGGAEPLAALAAALFGLSPDS